MKHSKLGIEIIKGLDEVIEKEKGIKLYSLSEITAEVLPLTKFDAEKIQSLRQKYEMSPAVFADVIGISIKTLKSWESGLSKPAGVYARLLQVIDHDPKVVKYLVSRKKN